MKKSSQIYTENSVLTKKPNKIQQYPRREDDCNQRRLLQHFSSFHGVLSAYIWEITEEEGTDQIKTLVEKLR